MNDSQNIADLYQDIIEEKSSSHEGFKEVMAILKDAMKKGLVDLAETKSGFMIKSKVDSSQYLIHKGGKDFHPLRRYLQKLDRGVRF